MKTCFLIGHRDAPFIIRGKLEKAIAKAIADYGVTEFVVGQYGAFDKMVAACLAEAKKDHPELRLVLLLPYHPSERAVVLPAGFDASFYPPGMETATQGTVQHRGRFLVLFFFFAAFGQHTEPSPVFRISFAQR